MPRLSTQEVVGMLKTQERYAEQLAIEAKVRAGEVE
jgi:hypothetical protein